jgi:hypothetical protein
MNTFVVSEKKGEVLLPLQVLLQRIVFLPVTLWAFREMTIRYPQPFGLTVQVFERLTRELALGFTVGNDDLQKFLKADFQIIDGCIDAYVEQSLSSPSFTLECVDTSQWEIRTASDTIAKELERRGFKR